jgi:C-terminal processing protease CtpA/Prc
VPRALQDTGTFSLRATRAPSQYMCLTSCTGVPGLAEPTTRDQTAEFLVLREAFAERRQAIEARRPAAKSHSLDFTFGEGPMGLKIKDEDKRIMAFDIDTDGQAAKVGLREGDILVGINGAPVAPGTSRSAVMKKIGKAGRPLNLQFERQGPAPSPFAAAAEPDELQESVMHIEVAG